MPQRFRKIVKKATQYKNVNVFESDKLEELIEVPELVEPHERHVEPLEVVRHVLVSISPTFYVQLLRVQGSISSMFYVQLLRALVLDTKKRK